MNDVFKFIERGRLLLEQGRTDEALKQAQQAMNLDPESTEALSLTARCHYARRDIAAGISAIRSAIALEPENSYYHYLLGFGYYRDQQHAPAVRSLEHSIRLNPYFAESYGLLAYVYRDEKDFKQALAKANEGLAIDPENITCLNVRSIAQNKLSMTDEAIETMQYALAQDPENEYTHSTIGWNYLEKGKHRIAGKHFREALRIDPNLSNAKEGLKESLKSKIPPYRWLLRYSFWINNKGKKARWMIPLGLYFGVRILATALNNDKSTEIIGGLIVVLYLLFVITSWLINPIANLFLLFHPYGRYALSATEKYTAISVVSSLLLGVVSFLILVLWPVNDKDLQVSWMVTGAAFLALSIPLGGIEYPVSFKKYGRKNKVSLVLAALGLCTIILAFLYTPLAMITGVLFLLLFAFNNWLSIFR